MKIRIPKDMRGVSNPHVLTIDLNDFDIDLFLPSLFFKVIAGGASPARRPNDPTNINHYVKQLCTNPDLVGCDDVAGQRLLGRLTRSTIAVMGRTGRGRGRSEQILAIAPFSLLGSVDNCV